MITTAEVRREESLFTEKAVIEASKLLVINNNNDCERLLTISYDLGKRIESGEKELQTIFELITERIEQYEEAHFTLPSKITPEGMMKALMEEHGDNQSSMNDVASRPVINLILNGKRKLTRQHIEKLCRKYNVSGEWFYPAPHIGSTERRRAPV